MMYLIEELHLDPMENSAAAAVSWVVVGVTSDPVVKHWIDNASPLIDAKAFCWALAPEKESIRRFRTREMPWIGSVPKMEALVETLRRGVVA